MVTVNVAWIVYDGYRTGGPAVHCIVSDMPLGNVATAGARVGGVVGRGREVGGGDGLVVAVVVVDGTTVVVVDTAEVVDRATVVVVVTTVVVDRATVVVAALRCDPWPLHPAATVISAASPTALDRTWALGGQDTLAS